MKTLLTILLCCCFLTTLAGQERLVNTVERVELTLIRNKQVIPLSLPTGTTSYLYAITVLKKNERQDERGSLYEQALRMVEEYPIEQIPSRVSLQHANKHSVNVILVQGETNAKDMREGKQFDYFEYFVDQETSATHVTSGPMEEVYLGIENRRIPRRYRVLVEVVAIVE